MTYQQNDRYHEAYTFPYSKGWQQQDRDFEVRCYRGKFKASLYWADFVNVNGAATS